MRRGLARTLNHLRGEVDAARETGHRRQDRYDPWRAGVARNSHPEKGDVPGHKRREDLSQGKKLITSTAPDETVSAASSQSRTLT
jgi:hypothetical protein